MKSRVWGGRMLYIISTLDLYDLSNHFFPALLPEYFRLNNVVISRNAQLDCRHEQDVAIRVDQRRPGG